MTSDAYALAPAFAFAARLRDLVFVNRPSLRFDTFNESPGWIDAAHQATGPGEKIHVPRALVRLSSASSSLPPMEELVVDEFTTETIVRTAELYYLLHFPLVASERSNLRYASSELRDCPTRENDCF